MLKILFLLTINLLTFLQHQKNVIKDANMKIIEIKKNIENILDKNKAKNIISINLKRINHSLQIT